MHYYKFSIGDYRRDASHLTLLEHGAYRQLLDTYYLTETPISLDYAKVMRTHCARTTEEKEAIKNVLQEFFICTENGWIHHGCDKIILSFTEKSTKAKASAQSRWDANAMRTHSEGNANHKPITNNHKPITNKKHSAFALLNSLGISEQIASDFLAIRKAKRAPLTETALDKIRVEAAKANLTLEDALRICCERGWRGFNSEWMKQKTNDLKSTMDALTGRDRNATTFLD